MDTFSCCAYCWKNEDSWDQMLCFKCDGCQKKVHYGCIRSAQPSPLLGDTFFKFKCEACGQAGKEEFVRSSMSWHNVVLLALYNLHKTSQGRCGYFHWKGHICTFIDQHWNTIFGYQRKKTTVWMGTVAGTLSIGCPEYFLSGTQAGQQGHWQLAKVVPPIATAEKRKRNNRKKIKETPVDLNPEKRKCRKARESALAAAVVLKEKKSILVDTKELKKQKNSQPEEFFSLRQTENLPATRSSAGKSPSLCFLSGNDGTAHYEQVNDLGDVMLMTEDELDLDLGLMVTESSIDPRPLSPDVGDMLFANLEHSSCEISDKSAIPLDKVMNQEVRSDTDSECTGEMNIKDEPASDSCDEEERLDEEGDEQEDVGEMKWGFDETSSDRKQTCRPSKKRKLNDIRPPSPPKPLQRISLFEEGELLQKLSNAAAKQKLPPEMAQLRRKLICNQTNREFGLPVFDLEYQMNKFAKQEKTNSQQVPNSQQQHAVQFLTTKAVRTNETRDLDRFMMSDSIKKMESRKYTSFYQRLVGFQDHELTPVISPYTTRVLLPFIWRNFEISHKPLKLRLLQEILAFPHRNDPSWVQPPCSPLDYCYVRPEHVPSVNALCREFFWPGIDVSECLQYPDFSCVVLYKKIVIAFAFMVPDRGYNEAYISFIFTHPEWRGAGIATFMLYHLIQTCMGKDVLLHVSATNPAMLLYQKFGFKCQELILNFYYKYFPLQSKESTHAFLMRLSR